MDVVERFLSAMSGHDWAGMADCVTEDVRRVGPFGDVYIGKGDYVAFISGLMPTLEDYRMEVERVTYVTDQPLAFAELAETVTFDGRPVRTPEVLVYGLSAEGLICNVEIYIQSLPAS